MTLLVRFISLASWLQISLWCACAVAIGGMLTLIIRYLPRAWMHFLLACTTSITISIVCALILIFDTPFSGDISISRESYVMAWHRLGGED